MKFFKLITAIFLDLFSSPFKAVMRTFVFILILSSLSQAAWSQQHLAQSKVDELYTDALALYSHRELGAAHRTFTSFLQAAPSTDPRRPDAQYYAAICAVSLYHADGEKRAEDFIATYPTNPKSATVYYELGNLHYQQKNYVKAIASYSKVDFPSLTIADQGTGHFRWGYSLFNQRRLEEALDQFNFVKAQGGQYGPASSYYAGYIEFTRNDNGNALVDLRRAEQHASYSSIVPYMIAQVLYKLKNYDELLNYAKSLATRDNVAQLDEIALLTSEVYYSRGDFANALTGYETYLADRKDADHNVLFRAGYAALRVANDQKAISFFKQAASGADSVGAYSSYYLGSLYLKTNQKQQAFTAFDVARKFKGDKGLGEESSFQFAKLAYDLGRSDQAIDELEKFQAAYPSSGRINEVKEILSHAYVNANNFNKAIEYIESLPRRGPSVDRAYQKATHLKGGELFNMERYADAVAAFEKSLQFPVDPAMAGESHYWAAEALSILNRNDQAIAHYASIISPASGAKAEQVHASRYGLGYAYYNARQYDRALFNFREYVNQAKKGDEYLLDAQLRLADCYYATKAYPEAANTYRAIVQSSSPDKDYAALQAGKIFAVQKRYAEATTSLNQVIQAPGSSHREEAMFELGQTAFEQGKYSDADREFTRLIDGHKLSRFVPYAHLRRAAANYNLKNYQKTADDYIVLITHYPTHPATADVLLPLQEALNLAGKPADFDQYLASFKTANPDSKGVESVEFEAAKNLYFAQDYTKAIQRLSAYAAAYPESARLSEAIFYQSESYYRLRDYPNALKGYYQISGDDSFSMLSKAVARIGELEFRAGNYEKAAGAFQELSLLAANKKEQYTAWSGLMESNYLLAQYDSADRYAHIILEKGNINAGAGNKAALFLGKTAMARGDYETAQDEFLHTLNTAQDEYGAEAKYLMAEIFYLTKQHKQCHETLLSLNKDFAAYTDWVGKSFLLLADNYAAQGELFQARGTLQSLVDNFPTQSVKDQAMEKIRKIDQQELEQKQESAKDTIDNE